MATHGVGLRALRLVPATRPAPISPIRREHPTLKPIPLLITGGDKATLEAGTWRVPKRDLVGALQVLLQTKRLKIAATLIHAATLVDELLNFRVKIDPLTAHDSYGAWREGQNDDLVLALACAVWYGVRTDAKPWTLGSYPIIHQ